MLCVQQEWRYFTLRLKLWENYEFKKKVKWKICEIIRFQLLNNPPEHITGINQINITQKEIKKHLIQAINKNIWKKNNNKINEAGDVFLKSTQVCTFLLEEHRNALVSN